MTFNEHMFALAKDAAGLTQSAIAMHAGVSQSLLSKIENGLESPTDTFVRSAAEATGVPVEFFHQDYQPSADTLTDIFHKKRATLPMKPLKRANARAQIERFRIIRLLSGVEVPIATPFPSFPLDQYDSPGEVATLTRSVWRLPRGPVPDLVATVEASGVAVVIADLEHDKLRAMCMPGAGDGMHIVTLNGRLPPSAQRFALAHEVGHLVMHAGQATPEMEKEADDFAAALLMPAGDIAGSLRNVRFRDLGSLKQHWRVSLAALIYRAHTLGVISERHYRTLNMDLNRLPNGRKREPGEFPAEVPTLISRVIEYYLSQQDYSVGDLCRLMAIDVDGFRRRYLGEHNTEVRLRVIRN